MKLENDSRTTLTHGDLVFYPGNVADIPDNIAKIWLHVPGIKQYVNPEEVKANEAKAAQELEKALKTIETLEEEIKELKDQNYQLEKKLAAKATKTKSTKAK